MTILAYTDGASRGNPGESGIGIVLKNESGQMLASIFGYIGRASNNMAEYTALSTCLRLVQKYQCTNLIVHSDSELMVRQLNGLYKVKAPELKKQYHLIQKTVVASPFQFSIKHISREEND